MTAQPTNELRFVNRVTSHATQTVSKILQQKWITQKPNTSGWGGSDFVEEWRDVPVADEVN